MLLMTQITASCSRTRILSQQPRPCPPSPPAFDFASVSAVPPSGPRCICGRAHMALISEVMTVLTGERDRTGGGGGLPPLRPSSCEDAGVVHGCPAHFTWSSHEASGDCIRGRANHQSVGDGFNHRSLSYRHSRGEDMYSRC